MKNLIKIKSKINENGSINFKELNIDDFKEFDYYRIVNPITKEIFYNDNGKLKLIHNCHCYDIWGNNKSCDYCVSTNALVTNSTKKKLEQIDGNLFLARVFPIIFDDKTYVLELFQDIGDSYVKTENENLQLSQIVTQLNLLASKDSFSGLFSHGFMYNKIMEITRDNIMPVALLCMDIDNMKYINDNFGHYEGDILIKKISDELIKLNSDNVFAARTGGDEFQVIFINYTKEMALDYSKPILDNLEKILIKDNYYASTSWAIEDRIKNQNAKELIESADSKMYKVKDIHHKN
jgi:diguanylate cyclase (GGDEF)-like protein